MKLSYLIEKAMEHLEEYGDEDIKINLLTEKQSNFLDDEIISIADYDGIFEIEIDVNNKKYLMKKIK